MIDVKVVDEKALLAFWLCFTRWLCVFLQMPLLDNMSIPAMVKVLLVLILCYAFSPYTSVSMAGDISWLGGDGFWILTLFNAIIGLAMGFMVKAIMMIFTSAGTLMTQQIGFSAVSYFDVTNMQQSGPFEILLQWTMLIIVLSSGLLFPMFKGIYDSFFSIHFMDLGKMANSPVFFLEFFKSIFLSGLLLASPLIFSNILIMIVLGIISRTVPQMNIIMVSFVVNIGLGLLIFIVSSDEFFNTGFQIYTNKLAEWFHLMR